MTKLPELVPCEMVTRPGATKPSTARRGFVLATIIPSAERLHTEEALVVPTVVFLEDVLLPKL